MNMIEKFFCIFVGMQILASVHGELQFMTDSTSHAVGRFDNRTSFFFLPIYR